MTHIVTAKCDGCRFTECVETCPVACFHGDDDRLYIDPDECIDCSACIQACPVRAIYDTEDMPEEYEEWIDINRIRSAETPVVSEKSDPKPTALARKAELGY